jgi:ribosome-binding factor A
VSYRLARLNSLMRQELSELLQRQVKDPRLSGMISVTEVSIAPDLKFAKVYVSSLGGVAEKDKVLRSLASAAGFLRGELSKNIRMRSTPELEFLWDDSIERGAHILELLDQVKTSDGL